MSLLSGPDGTRARRARARGHRCRRALGRAPPCMSTFFGVIKQVLITILLRDFLIPTLLNTVSPFSCSLYLNAAAGCRPASPSGGARAPVRCTAFAMSGRRVGQHDCGCRWGGHGMRSRLPGLEGAPPAPRARCGLSSRSLGPSRVCRAVFAGRDSAALALEGHAETLSS